MAEEKMAGRTKAAVLLITLGDEPSSKILKYLNEKEIEGVTFEIARHPRIDPGERDKVVSEFSEMLMAQEVIQQGGIDYAIVSQLPLETQADVAKSIATMDRTSPDVLREVVRVLDRKLSSLVNEE